MKNLFKLKMCKFLIYVLMKNSTLDEKENEVHFHSPVKVRKKKGGRKKRLEPIILGL